MDAIALAYVDVLRYLAANGPLPVGSALANACGKVPSNLKRDWPKLTAAGYVDNPLADETFSATDKARRLLQALDVADGRLALPDGFAALRHDEIAPHPLNPRKRFDEAALDELRGDIVQTGHLLQSLLLRPADPEDDATPNGVRFWIVAGERRWRAIGLAIFEGDWPGDRLLPAQVRDIDDRTHLRMALSENMQRADLDHVELAQTFKAMVAGGETPQSIADDLNKSPEYVQQHLRILRLPADTLDLVRDGEISLHEALRRERQMRMGVDDFDLPHKPAMTVATSAPMEPPPEPEPPLLDLSPAQAVILVELADKARRDSVASFREGYTHVLEGVNQDRDFAALVVAGAVGLRLSMGETEARIIPQGPGSRWLKANGWAPKSDSGQPEATRFLLHSVRTELVGVDHAVTVLKSGAYLTPWLNPEPAAAAERQERLIDQHVETVNRQHAAKPEPEPEPYQPPLVAPSAEEQEDIDARAKWLAWAKTDGDAISTLADDLAELMRLARGTGGIKGLQNWSDPAFPVDQLADTAVKVFADGKVGTAAMLLAMLRHRGGPMGAQEHLGRAIYRNGLQLTAEAVA